MASFNKVILVGNLTRDPQVRYTGSGMAVCDLGLAVNRYWFDKATNTKKEETTFVDVTLWGRDAEVAGEYCTKGKPVLIEGRLKLDQWDDKQTGQKRSKLMVVGETLQLLGGRDQGAPSGGGGERPAGQRTGGNFRNQPSAPSSQSDYGDSDGGSYSDSRGPGPAAGGEDDVPF
jgi:single-strand DNA-binding protein